MTMTFEDFTEELHYDRAPFTKEALRIIYDDNISLGSAFNFTIVNGYEEFSSKDELAERYQEDFSYLRQTMDLTKTKANTYLMKELW